MSILDVGFNVFNDTNAAGGGSGVDPFAGGDYQIQESVGFTDALLSRIPSRNGGTQSLMGEATGFVKGLFGLADTGLELFGNLNARAADVTGSPIIDNTPSLNRAARANVGGVPVWLLVVGVGGVAFLLLRK